MYPNEDLLKKPGRYNIEFFIKNIAGESIVDKLPVSVIDFENVINFEYKSIHPDDTHATVILQNKENAIIEDVEINFKSPFFDETNKVSIDPKSSTELEILLDKERSRGYEAGEYETVQTIILEDKEITSENSVNFLEKSGISVKEEKTGFIIREKTITKTNEGNVHTSASIDDRKDIVSRLFTSYNVEPSEKSRSGLFADYYWEENLAPGESLIIVARTNYTLPFIIIILIVALVVFVRSSSFTPLSLDKKVSLVKTKGGEFALRINISVKARKNVSDLVLSDRLPAMTQLYSKHGRMPDRVEDKQLYWNIGHLNSGEERFFSYVIYSKMKTVGKFELPSARAKFKHGDKHENVFSNKAFFLSDFAGE